MKYNVVFRFGNDIIAKYDIECENEDDAVLKAVERLEDDMKVTVTKTITIRTSTGTVSINRDDDIESLEWKDYILENLDIDLS